MPNIKAAEKWARQTEKRTARNKEAKARLKTLFKKAVDGALEPAAVESAYDRAAAKGVIHKNKAARKKSRLAKTRKIAAPAAKPAKTRKAPARASSKKKK